MNFDHFTDRARQVVAVAESEARHLGHNYVGTEHLALALAFEVTVLESVNISTTEVRDQVRDIIGQGQYAPAGEIGYSGRARRVLTDLAQREALNLGDNYVSPEHILLGLIREGDGVAAQVLTALGADLTGTRRQLAERHQKGRTR